jgi:methionyl-tRNA formyltransferase
VAVANVYLGTSEFAAAVLRELAGSAHRPALVVTPPDRPAGRGRGLRQPPVATLASELGLPLHQTRGVNEPGSREAIRLSGAELGTVCAFGQLIREPLLSEVPMLNVHPSLLPRWRGAAPIERALLAGDEETGVAVMRLTEGLDSGPVALLERTEIAPEEDYGSLATRLAALGGRLLVRALDAHETGDLEFEPQADEGVTYAEKIGPGERRLDPVWPAAELERAVRALTPHVGVYFELPGGSRLGVRAARALEPGAAVVPAGLADQPGAAAASEGRLYVRCGEGTLEIERLQPPGKREMDSADWLRGHEPPARVGSA